MPLQSTGSISIGQIRNEFGRTGPVSLSSLYKIPAAANTPGSITMVKSIGSNSGVPVSGPIGLDGFHSSKAYYSWAGFSTTAETSHTSSSSEWCCCCGNSGYQGWQTVTKTVADNNGYATIKSGGLNYTLMEILFKGVKTNLNFGASTKLVGGKNNTTYPFTLGAVGGVKTMNFCFVPNKGVYIGNSANGSVISNFYID